MKKQVAIVFLILLWHVSLGAFTLETTFAYDYFRGIPDGSWNGNSGAVIALNSELPLGNWANAQLGGSYGFYNWDGRNDVDFGNSKKLQRIGFFTVGLNATYCPFRAGLAYDLLTTNHFGIYNLNPTFDQLRFQASYCFACEEVGVWGTSYLSTSHKHSFGIPTQFRAISQINLFWSHCFANCAKSTLWVGVPYQKGVHHKRPGRAIVGFALRAPLTCRLYVDGYGAYLWARSHGKQQSRNYGASLSLGLTYAFCNEDPCTSPYMPIANHANFLVDSNVNQ